MKIDTKEQFYRLYELGIFGNRALAWDSYKDLAMSNWRGDVCVRGRGIPRTEVRYNIPFENVRGVIDSMVEKGIPESILRFNQSMPDHALSIQGEVMEYTNPVTQMNGFELTYTEAKKPMNEGFRIDTKFATGLAAKMILKGRMDPSSFADLEALLEIYPDSAVEFSTYEVNVGDIPGRNTVIWEVRNY